MPLLDSCQKCLPPEDFLLHLGCFDLESIAVLGRQEALGGRHIFHDPSTGHVIISKKGLNNSSFGSAVWSNDAQTNP